MRDAGRAWSADVVGKPCKSRYRTFHFDSLQPFTSPHTPYEHPFKRPQRYAAGTLCQSIVQSIPAKPERAGFATQKFEPLGCSEGRFSVQGLGVKVSGVGFGD